MGIELPGRKCPLIRPRTSATFSPGEKGILLLGICEFWGGQILKLALMAPETRRPARLSHHAGPFLVPTIDKLASHSSDNLHAIFGLPNLFCK